MSSPLRFDLRPGVTEPVVLVISRRQVEAGDIASVLSNLKPFLATREDAWLYRGQMSLVVDGYNEDPRDLVDILDVREFLRTLPIRFVAKVNESRPPLAGQLSQLPSQR